MTTEKQVRRQYTEDFKHEAVALVTEQGYKVSEAARSVGVNANLLSKWRDRFAEEAAGTRLTGDEREELKELRKAVRLLKMEKDILKKASQYFARHLQFTGPRPLSRLLWASIRRNRLRSRSPKPSPLPSPCPPPLR